MLVLSRKIDECLVVDDCVLRIVLVRDDFADVHVDAPKEYRIVRIPQGQSFSSPVTLSLEKGDSFLITSPAKRIEKGREHIGRRFDDEVCCVLIDIRGEKARLGIDAP